MHTVSFLASIAVLNQFQSCCVTKNASEIVWSTVRLTCGRLHSICHIIRYQGQNAWTLLFAVHGHKYHLNLSFFQMWLYLQCLWCGSVGKDEHDLGQWACWSIQLKQSSRCVSMPSFMPTDKKCSAWTFFVWELVAGIKLTENTKLHFLFKATERVPLKATAN